MGVFLESIDSRVKRVEQRLSSIEKFIAENLAPKKNNYDINLSLGRVSEPVAVSKDYHYDYSADINSKNNEKIQFHKVDATAFNSSGKKRITFSDDTITTLAICSMLVLALIFFGRFIMDSAWLGQSGQISLALCVGVFLIALGYLLEDKFGNTSKFFPILGQILLYISFYGASSFYQVIPRNIALAGILLTSVIGILQYQKNKLNVYLIVSAIGAYIMPLYISYQSEAVFVNLYFLITSLFFLYASVWLDLKTLALVGAYLSLGVCAVSEYLDNDIMNQVLFTLGHFIIYAAAYVLIQLRQDDNIEENKLFSYVFFPFVLLFYVIEYYYINLSNANWSPLFTGLVSTLLFVLYFLCNHYKKNEKQALTCNLLLSSASITLVHTLFYVVIPAKFRPISLVISVFVIAKFLETLNQEKWKNYSQLFVYFLLAVIGWNYFEVIFKQFSAGNKLSMVSGVVYVVVFLYVTYFEKKLAYIEIKKLYGTAASHIMMLSIVYNLFKNQGAANMFAGVGIYLLLAIGSLIYLNKKENEYQA